MNFPKSWEVEEIFVRSKNPSEKVGYTTYTMDPQLVSISEQLEFIVSGNWYQISKENYEFFSRKYPQRFI